ncbi:MAG: sodium:proton antiporter NhaD [Prevotella sp.]|jgi:Na+/H+ antiporter NhaD/arsenite permease-like protein|nr:sodium:proton antiporter NhaD [Prevotella sp.]MCH3994013.1 sodium:proton antiporter NhaD [Prevotella sp.]
MPTLSIIIIIAFCLGYLFIALESVTKVNKAAIALFMFVVCWTLYMISPESYNPGVPTADLPSVVSDAIERHLGSTSTTLFFLMGAMAIVEIVDQNGGFDWVSRVMKTRSKRALLWKITFMTFFLSAILDNMTSSIVMIMILRKLTKNHQDRLIYSSMIILAANSGGAFSPIGDVTTIMLWNKGLITPLGVITEIFIPSVISIVIPALILQTQLSGQLETLGTVQLSGKEETADLDFSERQRLVIFFLGVGGLIFVPIFKALTDLPPFVGILLVLSVLWIVTEIFYRRLHRFTGKTSFTRRVADLLSHIDLSTILFFLGVLMAVSCLEEIGALKMLGHGLNTTFQGNHYMVTGIIGVLSSVIDNVPLVAGCMGMYPLQATGDMATDGIFWQLLAYCAGTGGSILIIGSAAGVVVMGLEKITFGWYMKHVSWIAFAGYLVGILSYWLIRDYVIVLH